MGKEIKRREGSNVLFEPPEPIFPENFPHRRLRPSQVVALVAALGILAIVWLLAVSGKGLGGGESESKFPSGAERVTGSVSETMSDKDGEPTLVGKETETEGEYGGSADATETVRGFESETEEETAMPPVTGDVAELDLSEIERGEGYVVNYTDREIDVEGLLDRGFVGGEAVGSPAPLVLIIHTHTSESYIGSEVGFRGLETVVSAGEAICTTVNRLGISAVHCTVIHDGSDRNAYLNARDTVEMMLEIYPSIKYVIDVHRLALYDEGLPIKTTSGERDGSAQIRLTVGANGENGGWQETLALCLSLRKSLNRGGGRICMPVAVSQSLAGGEVGRYYMKVDIGASGNTVEEAIAAGKRLAIALAYVLIG